MVKKDSGWNSANKIKDMATISIMVSIIKNNFDAVIRVSHSQYFLVFYQSLREMSSVETILLFKM